MPATHQGAIWQGGAQELIFVLGLRTLDRVGLRPGGEVQRAPVSRLQAERRRAVGGFAIRWVYHVREVRLDERKVRECSGAQSTRLGLRCGQGSVWVPCPGGAELRHGAGRASTHRLMVHISPFLEGSVELGDFHDVQEGSPCNGRRSRMKMSANPQLHVDVAHSLALRLSSMQCMAAKKGQGGPVLASRPWHLTGCVIYIADKSGLQAYRAVCFWRRKVDQEHRRVQGILSNERLRRHPDARAPNAGGRVAPERFSRVHAAQPLLLAAGNDAADGALDKAPAAGRQGHGSGAGKVGLGPCSLGPRAPSNRPVSGLTSNAHLSLAVGLRGGVAGLGARDGVVGPEHPPVVAGGVGVLGEGVGERAR